ncbi:MULTISPECIES: hypothetical protein [Paraburkholderia]|uniref:hypothetical protein n=1 Tax=Paraburkholderia TaxID=1822464 RepID=UPI00037A03A3|nr:MULTISPECIES: hypothetical protein [Paraburkholderia]MDH6152108.1 nitrate reductase NapE component [Paraburkholderia sp. WSM4179]
MSTMTNDAILRVSSTRRSMTMQAALECVNWTQLCDQILIFVFGSSLYAAILYNLDINSGVLAGIWAFAIVVAVVIYGYVSRSEWRTTIVTILFIAVVLFAFGFLREFSFDGLNYHIATPLSIDHTLNGVADTDALGGSFWAAHYPKAFEYFAYTAKVLTSRFNSGKSFTLLLSVPACVALMGLLQSAGISARASLIASVASVYNPVALGQVTSFYVDAAHYYCWAIFSVHLLFALKRRPYSGVQLGIALVLLIGSKLTGPAFAAISIAVFFTAEFIGGEKRRFLTQNRKVIGELVIWSVVAVAVIGYSPYVQNIVAGKHIFYPVLGSDKVDIIGGRVSAHFLAMNPLQRIFLSYFSLPLDCRPCENAEPIFVPSYAHLRDAFIALHTAAARFGAFGPFFGVMFIACIASFFWRRRDGGEIAKVFLLATLASVLLHPQSWWARYVPMFYMVPFLVIAGFSSNRKLFHVVLAFGIANSVLAAASVTGYILLKETYYKDEVAAVRTICGQEPILLASSEMNWEADLRDDSLVVAAGKHPANSGCPVNFDEMMVMNKYPSLENFRWSPTSSRR